MWKRRKQIEPFQTPRVYRAGALVVFSVAILITLLIFAYKNQGGNVYPSDLHHLKWNSFWSSVQFNPTVELVNQTEIIWQIPDSAKAVLFIAHGCNGRATNFWDRSPSCQNCVGLPEERLMVLQALNQRYAVLTISSLGRCWSFGDEQTRVQGIIQWWLRHNNLEKLPIMALGASSGGYFVSALAEDMKFSSIVLMIAEGVFDSMTLTEDYPPTLFVHMPKDRIRKVRIKKNIEALRKIGVLVEEVESRDFPLTPKFLSDRIPCLDETMSVKLFEIFREKGFINEKNYLKRDGRATHWKEALKDAEPSVDDHDCADHVQEELNLAFGYHEMTSLQMKHIIRWFESHARRLKDLTGRAHRGVKTARAGAAAQTLHTRCAGCEEMVPAAHWSHVRTRGAKVPAKHMRERAKSGARGTRALGGRRLTTVTA